jgi:tetratricopeptide (TPR) repeat protein
MGQGRRAWIDWTVIAIGLLAAAPVFGDEAARPVIPPGRETIIGRMVGDGVESLSGGCALVRAAILQAVVKAEYACGGVAVEVLMRHPEGAAASALRTSAFAIEVTPADAPAEFVATLLQRVKEGERGWEWQMVAPKPADATPPAESVPPPPVPAVAPVEAAGSPAPQPPAGPPTPGAVAPDAVDGCFSTITPDWMPPDVSELYYGTDELIHKGEYRTIFDRMVTAARRCPHTLVLGRLVVACAGLASEPGKAHENVERFLADADAHPDDLLKQFIAGVSVHYRGHLHGQSREEKTAEYVRAIGYLERARGGFVKASRQWLYLGISYYRTGRQAEAEAAINHALEVDSGRDADVYYSRAEIFHRKDVDAAIADLEKYAEVMANNRKVGGYSAPHKDARVKHMLEHLEKVRRGEAAADAAELFDPVRSRTPGADGVEPSGPSGGLAARLPSGVSWSAETQAAYDRSHVLVTAGKNDEAYRLMLETARREPANLILTRLGFTVANTRLTLARVQEFQRDADANPADGLLQFIAGIAWHYYAHGQLKPGPERSTAYQNALVSLVAAAKTYPYSDRVWLYQAVSQYRLGHQAEAEDAITKAFAQSPDAHDPDVYYCRAEIFHRKDLAQSISDLEQYHLNMQRNIAQGAIHAPEKEERVLRAIEKLKLAHAGKMSLEEADPFEPLSISASSSKPAKDPAKAMPAK